MQIPYAFSITLKSKNVLANIPSRSKKKKDYTSGFLNIFYKLPLINKATYHFLQVLCSVRVTFFDFYYQRALFLRNCHITLFGEVT